MTSDLPYLTTELPGIGGRIKVEIDDFEVEEIPAYEPCGEGSHLYLWVEKRDLGAEYFLKQMAQRLGIRPFDIGVAGMKDRRAVARQWVSVLGLDEARAHDVEGNGIRVLKVSRHGNKLRAGHLAGNRFRILIRDCQPERAEAILNQLNHFGMPNFFGEQRFGRGGETGELGMRQLKGEKGPRYNPFLRKLSLSAAQSLLFNHCLARRMHDGLLRTVVLGDVLAKWPDGGKFFSTDPAADQPRLDRREVVITGPMFGKKMFPAHDQAAEREAAVLADFGLTAESFLGFGKLLEGTRRHYFVYPGEVHCEMEPAGLRTSFTLPAGSYATVLLRELMKTAPEPITD